MKVATEGVNHRNKIGRQEIAIPCFWDAFHGCSSFGSTAKVAFQVGMYISTERKRSAIKNTPKEKKKEREMNENYRKMFQLWYFKTFVEYY